VLLLLAPLGRFALAQDAATANDIGLLLSAEDHRVFDSPLFVRMAQHPDSLVRQRAAIAMGRIGDRGAVQVLAPMLADRDSMVRTEAAFALGRLGDRSVVPELAALSARFAPVESGEFITEIVTALAKLGGPEAERALGAILDRHPAAMSTRDDRATAQVLLETWRLGRRSPLAARLRDYVRDARGDWRRNATYSTTRPNMAFAVGGLLLDAAQDSDAATRGYAARGLTAAVADSSGVAREAFVTRLRTLVNDDDAGVRVNALAALATYADSALAPVAASRLVDRDPNVTVRAAQTLGALRGSRAAAALAERFPAATSFGLRRGVLVALAAVDPALALETGRSWRIDTDWRNRAAYAEMLGVARNTAARQQLQEMLTDPEPRVVGFVLNALDAVVPPGDTALITMARVHLASPDIGVRNAAIDLLGREKNPAFLRDLTESYRRAEGDAQNDARLAAVRAMADVWDANPGARLNVESSLLGSFPRSPDYLVRRLVAQRFGEPALRRYWGSGAGPVETGRSPEEYRDLARRYVLGQARPGTLTIETERGNIVFMLYAAESPLTVENFLSLADRRFFDNGRWHRVVPNFVAQDGDPRGDGSGGSATVIRDEINRRRYDRGTVGMALSGPDTGNSQFFITFSPQPHLDGGYTVFGQVVSGWDILDQVVQGDRIRRIFRSP
jgi:cyclophilin family peptidyl-prolyl cis-trans isomerase/HEAT repeat protein